MAERSPSACTAIYATPTPVMPATNCASALLFFQWRIGFTRRRLRFGALGFAQRSFLVSLSLFLLAASTCRPRSLGSISSVIYLKCHRLLAGWITHSSALYKHVAMPLQRHVCASNYNDWIIGTVWRHGKRESTPSLTKVFRRRTSHSNFFARITSAPMSFHFCADGVAVLGTACIPATQSKRRSSAGACVDGN
jgi:hypothetical protein